MDRDNQAGKAEVEKERIKGYVAGFFDGEGYIGLYLRRDKKKDYYNDTYRPLITIVNTDEKTIDWLCSTFDDLGIAYYRNIKRKGFTDEKKWRTTYVIKITGFKRIKRFIDVFDGYFVTKQDQVSVMKDFIERRSCVTKNTPYCEKDHFAYLELRRLKGTLDTIPQRQRTYAGKRQKLNKTTSESSETIR